MLHSGHSIRFTAAEVAKGKALGFNLGDVKSHAAVTDQMLLWLEKASRLRPDLLSELTQNLTSAVES